MNIYVQNVSTAENAHVYGYEAQNKYNNVYECTVEKCIFMYSGEKCTAEECVCMCTMYKNCTCMYSRKNVCIYVQG
jgi:hypothetical protein